MDWLKENRSEDEELVAIVETDACGADAVQVVTGCTFGKGNFLHKDYGKQVLSLISRKSGKGVRIAMRAGAFQPNERHMELVGKLRSETATPEEIEEFQSLHRQRSCQVLEMPLEALFKIEPTSVAIPEKARVEPSKLCDLCGEPTMGSKLNTENDRLVCRDCLAAKRT